MADIQVASPCPCQSSSRSSGRLRDKSQRRFSLPSRKEVLDSYNIASEDETPSKDYSHLKPRKLINNFIKERNSYNNPDGIDLFDENSDEEFINDNSSSDDRSDVEASSVSQEGSIQTSDSTDDGENEKSSSRRPSRRSYRKRVSAGRKTSQMGNKSDDDEEEELAVPLRTHKNRLEDASSGDNLSPLRRKRRRSHKVSIQSDGSSSGDEAASSAPSSNLPLDKKISSGHSYVSEKSVVSENSQSEEIKPNLKQVEYASDDSDQTESSSSFIATSDSSDIIIPDSDDTFYSERGEPSKPSHEELMCNYRQKKSRVKKSQRGKRQRVHQLSGSSSSDNGGSGEYETESAQKTERPPSKRAELLSSKKEAWKSDTLGVYRADRERKLSKKKDTCVLKTLKTEPET